MSAHCCLASSGPAPVSRWCWTSIDGRSATEPDLAGRCHAFEQRREIATLDPDDLDAARRLERVLTTDPGTGVMRHADAGYDEAIAAARQSKIDLPMV